MPQRFKLDGFNLGQWIGVQRKIKDSMSPERKQRLDDIDFIWDALTEAWEEGFNKLAQFKELEGHCRVPQRFKLDGFNLGQWIGVQRKIKDSMSPERRQRLDDSGFIWDALTEAWEEGFNKLAQFKELEGHCRVPHRFKPGGFNLGGWVSQQRCAKDSMSSERRQRLDDSGFIWDLAAADWEERFNKLLQFKELEGHCRVPQGFKLGGLNLGSWVSDQRKIKDDMSSERKQRLDDIDFIWDSPAAVWEERFNKLLQFKELEGHCRVPQGFKLGGINLGNWVSKQRSAKDSMSPERRQRLDDSGFIWDKLEADWEEGFYKLAQFKELEGHCRVPQGFKLDGLNLGNWVSNRRKAKDNMSAERKQKLDDIGFIWDVLADNWEEGFSKLLQFKELEGHCRVPTKLKFNDFTLGVWVSHRRTEKDSMAPERNKRLDDIGFIWDTSKDKS